MLLLIFLALWAFSLFYGISLIRTDRRKLGIRYLMIFSVLLTFFAIGMWWMEYGYLSCMLNDSADMEYCSTFSDRKK
jgi:hypothetical protein